MKRKKFLSLMLACMMMCSVTACNSAEKATVAEEQQKQQATDELAMREIRMNDYLGGTRRTLALKENILALVDTMKSNNAIIRENSPDTFWSKDGYQDFVTNFMNSNIIDDTMWFNEEEASWEDTYQYICSNSNSFTSLSDGSYVLKSGISILRNEKDDYSVTGLKDTLGTYSGGAEYRILYDCDKDWCKAYKTIDVNSVISPVVSDLYEYARLDDDTFAIQTYNERILVKLAPSGTDMDIRDREITEFYYSKLVADGVRTTFEPFEYLPEVEDDTSLYLSENAAINKVMQNFSDINANGDYAYRYGKSDSMFLVDNITKDITDEWVFEDKSLQQALCYKNGTLVVTTYNKLSEKYERFEYAVSGSSDSTIKELEKLVEISSLVGVVELQKTSAEEIPEETDRIDIQRKELEELGYSDEEIEDMLQVTEAETQETAVAETTEPSAETTETAPAETDSASEETTAEETSEAPEGE